jgi:hypothetical protein
MISFELPFDFKLTRTGWLHSVVCLKVEAESSIETCGSSCQNPPRYLPHSNDMLTAKGTTDMMSFKLHLSRSNIKRHVAFYTPVVVTVYSRITTPRLVTPPPPPAFTPLMRVRNDPIVTKKNWFLRPTAATLLPQKQI